MIEIVIAEDAWLAALPDCEALAQAAAAAALTGHSDAANGDIAILLTSDEAVRQLNRDFRGKDSPTNVLSFPAPDMTGAPLGDIALALGVCAQEADEQRKALAAHLQHLVVHGVLHLLGYDHDDDAEAESMEALEIRILSGLGVSSPYE